jgi:cytochrome c peroxidase
MYKLLISLMLVVSAPAHAQLPALFAGADVQLGEKLISENNCSACHQQKVGGDGSAIYKPTGRINAPGALRGMVDQCNTELNLGLFPDEVTAVSAALNRNHYHFK